MAEFSTDKVSGLAELISTPGRTAEVTVTEVKISIAGNKVTLEIDGDKNLRGYFFSRFHETLKEIDSGRFEAQQVNVISLGNLSFRRTRKLILVMTGANPESCFYDCTDVADFPVNSYLASLGDSRADFLVRESLSGFDDDNKRVRSFRATF